MELLCVPIWLCLLTLIMAMVVYYVWAMSMHLNLFERMRVIGPGPTPILGNLGHVILSGLYQSQVEMYRTFKAEKVFGIFDSRTPCMVVRDKHIIHEILVNQFHKFPNRQRHIHGESILNSSLPLLQDKHWEYVRKAVASTLSDHDTLKRIPERLEKTNRDMLEYIKEQIEEEEEVDLRELFTDFSVDSTLSTCFGIEANSFQDPEYSFMGHIRKINSTFWYSKMVNLFLPFSFFGALFRILRLCSCENSVSFFNKLTDDAILERNGSETLLKRLSKENVEIQERNQTMTNGGIGNNEEINASQSVSRGSFSERDLKGQALALTLSSYETLTSVMSYTLFMLANNPECCERAQAEIDSILEQEPEGTGLNYGNVHRLVYLDMCIKETMRMFPSSVNVDRICVNDVIINGVHFPKDMPVFIPVHAIHQDPELWPNPEEFDPYRFLPDEFDTSDYKYRNNRIQPYSYLPFGDGPRMCVGKDLAMLQIKLGIAAILRTITPSPSCNTAYPPKLSWFSHKASDGLWVAMSYRCLYLK